MRVRISTLRSFVRKALREHAEGQQGRDFDHSPGYSGDADMARTQLKNIAARATKLHDALEDGDDLPAWVLSKMAVADSYMTSLSDYLHGEIDRSGGDADYSSEYGDDDMESDEMDSGDMSSMLSTLMGGEGMEDMDDDSDDSMDYEDSEEDTEDPDTGEYEISDYDDAEDSEEDYEEEDEDAEEPEEEEEEQEGPPAVDSR